MQGSMKVTMDVVICTRNREENVLKLIDNLASAENSIYIVLWVIDASDSSRVREKIFSHLRRKDAFAEFSVLTSKPGLPRQRNLALDSIKSEIVTFLDDDTLVAPNFISKTLELFDKNEDVVGCSPRISDLYLSKPINFPNRKAKCISIVQSKIINIQFGKVTKSGDNFWFPDISRQGFLSSDWLPGCAMSYRVSAIKDLRFDTRLEKGPTGGYALGEDVDFSLRARSRGRLGCNTETFILHYQELGVRDDQTKMAQGRGIWLSFLAQNHPKFVSKYRVILQLLAKISFALFFDLVKLVKRQERSSYKVEVEILSYFLKNLRKSSLI